MLLHFLCPYLFQGERRVAVHEPKPVALKSVIAALNRPVRRSDTGINPGARVKVYWPKARVNLFRGLQSVVLFKVHNSMPNKANSRGQSSSLRSSAFR